MLAYFFYHWKKPDVDATEYEERLRDFHETLNAAPSDGFTTSWSVALTGRPWANHGGPSYEDWYIVRNSADLDPLNDAAISASRKIPHDRAAAGLEGGSAGLYRVRRGDMVSTPRYAAWFSKPVGWQYSELYERLTPVLSSGSALWQRQMALGPGEFCLHSTGKVVLPDGIDAQPTPLRSVFPQRV